MSLKLYLLNFLSRRLLSFSFRYFFGISFRREKITRSDLHRECARQYVSTLRSMKAVVSSKRQEVVLAVFSVMAYSRFLIVPF